MGDWIIPFQVDLGDGGIHPMMEMDDPVDEPGIENDGLVMDLLKQYAVAPEGGCLIRVHRGHSQASPRAWNRLHGLLVARGLIEPVLAGDGEIPTPGYKSTRAGRLHLDKATAN